MQINQIEFSKYPLGAEIMILHSAVCLEASDFLVMDQHIVEANQDQIDVLSDTSFERRRILSHKRRYK